MFPERVLLAKAEMAIASGSAPHLTTDSVSAGPGVPPELAGTVTRINEAVVAGELRQAQQLALGLQIHNGQAYGLNHPHTLEANRLQAYIAHLVGDNQLSSAISLQVARSSHRLGDRRAQEDIARAALTWRLLAPSMSSIAFGQELLALWPGIMSIDVSAADAEALTKHRIHLERLIAVVAKHAEK
ncbi:hypothetical protein [Streptomyces chartreusis]|uniref:hypothetical protein n=1 Tax=Streptomyces chartreusis TaxID=1969 RepID=UPI0036C00209